MSWFDDIFSIDGDIYQPDASDAVSNFDLSGLTNNIDVGDAVGSIDLSSLGDVDTSWLDSLDFSQFSEPSAYSFFNTDGYGYDNFDSLYNFDSPYNFDSLYSALESPTAPSISTAALDGFSVSDPVAADVYFANTISNPTEANLFATENSLSSAFGDPVRQAMLLSQPQSMSTAQLDGFTVAPEASSAPEYIGPGSDSFNQYYNPQDGVVPTNAGIPTSFLSKLMAPSIQVVGSAAQRALMQQLGLAKPTKSNLASGIGAALMASQVAGAFGSDAKAPEPEQLKTTKMNWNKSIANKARGGSIEGQAAVPQGALGLLKGAQAGQDDSVPINASHGEYVMDADVVAALGDGNTDAGAAKLDAMRENIRKHKRSAPPSKIPPKAKPVKAYLKGAK